MWFTKCCHETGEIGIQLCHAAISAMSAHGHERIHHNDRVEKVEGASQWTRTEDTVLMAIGLVGPTREDLSEAGKACVRAAVQELCSGLPDEYSGDISYGPTGAPEWTRIGAGAQIFVSISHTSPVAVGVASWNPIGVDIERSQRDVRRLLRALTAEECDLMPRWSAIDILCAKEAAGKAQGVGLAGSIKRWIVSECRESLTVTDSYLSTSRDALAYTVEVLKRSIGGDDFTCVLASPQYPTPTQG